MKKEDLTKKSAKDLQDMLAKAYKTLGNARFAAAGSRARNTSEGKLAKKVIAQVKTELRKRGLKDNVK